MATVEGAEVNPSYRKPRKNHVRNPSAGSARSAFFANPPMPESFAKQKHKHSSRRSASSSVIEKESDNNQIDMMGIVNLALEQEAEAASSNLYIGNSTRRPPMASSSSSPYGTPQYSQQSHENLYRSQQQSYGSIEGDMMATNESTTTSSLASSIDLNKPRQPRRLPMIRDVSQELDYSIRETTRSTLIGQYFVRDSFMSTSNDVFQSLRLRKVSCVKRLREFLDPTTWLTDDVTFAEDDKELNHALFPEDDGHHSIRGFVRQFLYNPAYPEFTSLQLFVWSILIGIFMGFYTAFWKMLIEFCVDFVWDGVPSFLKRIGFFTELGGVFPMTHYMWMCPAFFGGVLSYIFAALPTKIPGQNEWIQNLHSKGVQDADTFWQLFILSTLGMSSGLSLGPELPLVLTAGMTGSWLGIISGQSVLQGRVLNLVAASSAVGGFFGFPMAGALFVLEVPHRSGLQYFEALNPAIFGSIVAVLTNRLIVQNDVTGYYEYPFLTSTLPSSIFWHAVIFGLFGTGLGIGYAKIVLKLKKWVKNIFHYHEDTPKEAAKVDAAANDKSIPAFTDEEAGSTVHPKTMETRPLVGKTSCKRKAAKDASNYSWISPILNFSIKSEPKRAAISGIIAGTLVGVIGMFLPHVMFWGEAQLQTIIDKGRTPLPIFGNDEEPNADLIAWGQCLIDRSDEASSEAGLPIACSAIIAVAKIITTGLSVGTGIIGGHFWAPLFVGCIASHFFTACANLISNGLLGHPAAIATYPCVAVLCTMGACHVVTFRAHTAIMLILTLTISAFDPTGSTDDGDTGGDYSAVFPLLVVAVFVALHVSKDGVVFYNAQRSRGDIMALPEVLCEPGKEGAPMVLNHGEDEGNNSYSDKSDILSSKGESTLDDSSDFPSQDLEVETRIVKQEVSQEEIELEFEKKMQQINSQPDQNDKPSMNELAFNDYKTTLNDRSISPKPSAFNDKDFGNGMSSARLDQLLAAPMEKPPKKKRDTHRRIMSASAAIGKTTNIDANSISRRRVPGHVKSPCHSRQNSGSSTASRDGQRFVRINSYGEVKDFQPSLIQQAQERASSLHRRLPSLSKARSRIMSSDSIERQDS